MRLFKTLGQAAVRRATPGHQPMIVKLTRSEIRYRRKRRR